MSTPSSDPIIVAIDGFSSCGKSTLARDLANVLGYIYIDTGAMYRAVTLFLLRNGIDIDDHGAVEAVLDRINIGFEQRNNQNHTILNGEDVEEEIRSMEVSRYVSPVSAISAVRRKLVGEQRKIGAGRGIVMDGRDIGTVVFPDAELKIFMTASIDVRIDRRLEELGQKGYDISRKAVSESILQRDAIDTSREDSPLRQAEDAIVIDNTELTRKEQLAKALALFENSIGK